MIVSPGRRYIFVHIPKTGGTALSLALEARARADDILIGDTPKARARRRRLGRLKAAGRLWKHSTLADIAGLLPDPVLDGLLVVTMVRNPWDRVVSYYHWLRAQGFAHPAVGLAKSHDFGGFLNHPQTRAALAAWPVSAYLRDRGGRERPALVLRRERLDDDLPAFEAHLGFTLRPLPVVNLSERGRDWRPFFSDADAALVARLCAEDIGRFAYRFDPDPPQG
jgi:hypothetical protein